MARALRLGIHVQQWFLFTEERATLIDCVIKRIQRSLSQLLVLWLRKTGNSFVTENILNELSSRRIEHDAHN